MHTLDMHRYAISRYFHLNFPCFFPGKFQAFSPQAFLNRTSAFGDGPLEGVYLRIATGLGRAGWAGDDFAVDLMIASGND